MIQVTAKMDYHPGARVYQNYWHRALLQYQSPARRVNSFQIEYIYSSCWGSAVNRAVNVKSSSITRRDYESIKIERVYVFEAFSCLRAHLIPLANHLFKKRSNPGKN